MSSIKTVVVFYKVEKTLNYLKVGKCNMVHISFDIFFSIFELKKKTIMVHFSLLPYLLKLFSNFRDVLILIANYNIRFNLWTLIENVEVFCTLCN